jgi:hypothetical protein
MNDTLLKILIVIIIASVFIFVGYFVVKLILWLIRLDQPKKPEERTIDTRVVDQVYVQNQYSQPSSNSRDFEQLRRDYGAVEKKLDTLQKMVLDIQERILEQYRNVVKESTDKTNELKSYKDGIYFNKHEELYRDLKDLYQNMYKFKLNNKVDETKFNYLFDDAEDAFRDLNVEVIKPSVGQIYDASTMRVEKVVATNVRAEVNTICALIRPGYKLKLKENEFVIKEVAVVEVYQ